MGKSGIELIAEERIRQIEVEGYTTDHDDSYESGQMAQAGACYAIAEDYRKCTSEEQVKREPPKFWPWPDKYWKPSADNRIKELAKAGALIAAEIDRLQRAEV